MNYWETQIQVQMHLLSISRRVHYHLYHSSFFFVGRCKCRCSRSASNTKKMNSQILVAQSIFKQTIVRDGHSGRNVEDNSIDNMSQFRVYVNSWAYPLSGKGNSISNCWSK